MFELMIFMFCFLVASIIMFFYWLKRSDDHYRNLNDEHAQLRVLMRAMESRLENMEKSLAVYSGMVESPILSSKEDKKQGNTEAAESANAGHDPLLHLSFEEPACNARGYSDTELDFLPDPAAEKRP